MTPLRRRVRVRAAFPRPGSAARLACTTALFLLAGCYSRSTPAPTTPAPSREEARPAREDRRRSDALPAPGASLVIPVRGVRPEQLRDSYHSPRSGGRTHHAIDIMAPRGTPVVAAADGTVLKLRTGGNGGITIYQLGADGRTLYYYAHLQRYAAGMSEGLPIQRGQVIAYVGDTGNAGPGNYHLHFSVGTLRDMRRWWDSENTNPFPLLAGDLAYRRTVSGSGQR